MSEKGRLVIFFVNSYGKRALVPYLGPLCSEKKKKLPETVKQVFCTQSLFDKIKIARATSLEIQARQFCLRTVVNC